MPRRRARCAASAARTSSPRAPKVEVRLASEGTSRSRPRPRATLRSFEKFEGFWTKQHNSVVECFECKAKHEVSSAATSTNCPKCSAHIDLRDYKITTSFSRSIRTHGEIHITAKGDLSSTNVICRSALIEGKLRGNLQLRRNGDDQFQSAKFPAG